MVGFARSDGLEVAEGVLAGVLDVEESILVLVLSVHVLHQRRGHGHDVLRVDEDGLFGRQLDTLPDDVDELSHGEVCRDQVLLLVDRCDIALVVLLADDLGNTKLASLCCVLVLLVTGEAGMSGRASGSDRHMADHGRLETRKRMLFDSWTTSKGGNQVKKHTGIRSEYF